MRIALALAAVLAATGVRGASERDAWLLDPSGEECTIAVISGRATADGRPLLMKTRDSGYLDNEVAFFNDGVWPYVALVTAGDTTNAWIGINSRGFAILNALSYNLSGSYPSARGPAGIPVTHPDMITNGRLMKLALKTCATVDDFRKLLDQTTGQRINPANLAVIDGQGGAAIFEAGTSTYVRFDADSAAAGAGPGGYLVRTNFSLSADTSWSETWRWRRGTALVRGAAGRGARVSDAVHILRDLCSETVNPYPLPYHSAPPGWPNLAGYIDTRETINRTSTVSAGVIQGVRPGEDPRLTTFYAMLGQPVVAPPLPVWVAAGETPAQLDGKYTAPFCDVAKLKRAACYDFPYDLNLMNTRRLCGLSGAGQDYLPLVQRLEQKVLPETSLRLDTWRANGVVPEEMIAFEHDLAASIFFQYASGSGGETAPGQLLVCTPNPMTERIGIQYRAGEAAPSGVGISIMDVLGRRVAFLGPERGQIGASTGWRFLWDGRDDGGARVPAGIYYCRPSWPPGAPSEPVIVVR